MIRIAIFDDEEHIIRLIQTLIPWVELDCEFVGSASNGVEGMKIIEEAQPNIVITDIQMPGVDGLEMIRRCHEENSGVNFIIISGHRQFDYARQAISYGVENYLVKPIDRTELIDTITKIKNSLLEETETQDALSSGEKTKRSVSFKEALTATSIATSKDFSVNKTCLVLLKLDFLGDSISPSLLKVACEKIETQLRKDKSIIASASVEDKIFLLVNGNDVSILSNINFNLKSFSSIFTKMVTFLNYINLSPGSLIANNAKKLEEALYLRYSKEVKQPLEVNSKEVFPALYCSPIFEKNANLLATSFDCTLIATLLDEIEKDILKNSKNYFLSLSYILHKVSIELEKIGEEGLEFEKETTLYLSTSPSIEDLFTRFRTQLLSKYSLIMQKRVSEQKKPIRDAEEYLNKHYMDYDISLDTVSEYVNLGSTYLSSLFKKEKGVGFQDVLTNIRLENAKRLLVESNNAIYEIASAVGYSDVKYFAKLFKKNNGLKPNEYRKLYS